MLHEVGISIAHHAYHKHGAYILGLADMPEIRSRTRRGSRNWFSASAENSKNWSPCHPATRAGTWFSACGYDRAAPLARRSERPRFSR